MPEAADQIQALQESIEAGNAVEAEKLYNDLFSGDPQSAKRFFEIAQMTLGGAGGSFIGINNMIDPAIIRDEKERKELTDRLWNSLILNEQIRALEAHIEDLNNRIADLSIKIDDKKREIAALEVEKSQLETQKSESVQELKEAQDRIQEIDDALIPEAEAAIAKRNQAFDYYIENKSGLDPDGIKNYRAVREDAAKFITVRIALNENEERLKPPPKHAVYKDEQGQLCVGDGENKRILQEGTPEHNSYMRQLAKGEAIATPQEAVAIDDRLKTHRQNLEKAGTENPNNAAALRKTSNENIDDNEDYQECIDELKQEKSALQEKVKTIEDKITGIESRLEEIAKELPKAKEDLAAMEAEQKKLELELEQTQEQLEEAKQLEQENKNQIKAITVEANEYSDRYSRISAFADSVEYKENLEKFTKGEIDLDRLYKNAPPEIQAIINDPDTRKQLEAARSNKNLTAEEKAQVCDDILIEAASQDPLPISAAPPALLPTQKTASASWSSNPEQSVITPIFTSAAHGAHVCPAPTAAPEPVMSPVEPVNKPLVIGTTP